VTQPQPLPPKKLGKGFRSIMDRVSNKKILTPYLDLGVTSAKWPLKYTITIDSSPYYGVDPETREPDGFFHPSTHSLMGERLLWYTMHPAYRDRLEKEPPSLQREMTFAMGSALHGVVQTQLTMLGLCKCSCAPGEIHTCGDIEVLHKGTHNDLGKLDFIATLPMHGRVAVEMKALALDTPVLTTTGWSTMGDLQDGDEVYAPDGQPTKVLRAHPIRHDRPCYRVKFRDGQSVVADADHLWQVNDRNGQRDRVMTTRELKDASWGDRYRFRVPVSDPLQMPEADLPIDPWLLGMWLGDGSLAHVEITSGEVDLPYLVSRLDELGQRHRVHRFRDRAPRVGLYGLRGAFAEQGLLRHPRTGLHGCKHIPEQYMLASEHQRRQLLAGLMDSDGTIGEHQASICMINEPLMRQVLQLTRSLGYRSTWGETTNDFGPVYWVKFSSRYGESPFDMPRKREKFERQCVGSHQNLRLNAIVAIEPVDSVPVRCITVAHESSLYVVGEGFVPTHNTMNTIAFGKLDDTVESMKPEWKAQLSLALHNLGFSWGILLVMQSGWPYRFEEIRFDRDDKLLSEIFERFDRVAEHLALDTPPEPCCGYGSKTMKSCPARYVCWLKNDKAVRR